MSKLCRDGTVAEQDQVKLSIINFQLSFFNFQLPIGNPHARLIWPGKYNYPQLGAVLPLLIQTLVHLRNTSGNIESASFDLIGFELAVRDPPAAV